MASLSRSPADSVAMSGSAFRGLIDLALDWPGTDSQLRQYLTEVRDVKGISLNLLEPSRRSLVEDALGYACEQGEAGRTIRPF